MRTCTQKERRDHLLDYCSRHQDSKRRLPVLYVLESKRTLYCHITKVAGTSLKTLMVIAASGSNTGNESSKLPVHIPGFLEKHGLKTLRQYSEDEQNYILKYYFKIIVVKHPLSRLVSTWRDKFLPAKSSYRFRIGKRIIAKFRDESYMENESWKTGHVFKNLLGSWLKLNVEIATGILTIRSVIRVP